MCECVCVCVNSAITAARSNYNATHGFADAIFVPIYNGGRHDALNEPNGKLENSIENFAAIPRLILHPDLA